MIRELRKKQQVLTKELDKINTEIRKYELEKIRKKLSLYEGCTVKCWRGRMHKVFRIEFDPYGDRLEKPFIQARQIKKDGSLSRNWSHLNDEWEFVK